MFFKNSFKDKNQYRYFNIQIMRAKSNLFYSSFRFLMQFYEYKLYFGQLDFRNGI